MLESRSMKKFLAIIVLGLLWSGNAHAEKVYLNCKFLNGVIDNYATRTSEQINYSQDVTIDLDLKNKKVLNGPYIGTNSLYEEYNNELSWGESFGEPGNGISHKVTLNRSNGSLEIYTIFTSVASGTKEYYKCEKNEKLF